MSKVCIARVDRIGDLILTLPCQGVWQERRPHDEILWLVHENLKFVITQSFNPSAHALYVKPVENFIGQIQAAFQLAKRIRLEKLDEVVAVHVPWWVAFAFYLARVKKRVGVASQWYSWLFFNRRLRQKRSQALKHEAQYNLDLIEFALGEKKNLELPAAQLYPLEKYVTKWRAQFIAAEMDLKKITVIHPGMAGSARNWPAVKYRELAAKLLAQNIPVVLTGGEGDREFLKLTNIENMRGVFSAVGKTDSHDLLAILSLAKTVVAPSTGVAHLAASLGVRVAGIYSPVRVQVPLRWGPRGKEVRVFVPQVNCPGGKKCIGPVCPSYDCMAEIPVDSVASYVMDRL